MLRILHGELSVSLLTGFLLFRVKGTRSKSTVPNTLFPLQLSSEMHSKCFGIVSYEAIFTISSLICFRLHLLHQSKQIFRNRSNAENLGEINSSGAALDLALGAAAARIFCNTGFTTRKTTDYFRLFETRRNFIAWVKVSQLPFLQWDSWDLQPSTTIFEMKRNLLEQSSFSWTSDFNVASFRRLLVNLRRRGRSTSAPWMCPTVIVMRRGKHSMLEVRQPLAMSSWVQRRKSSMLVMFSRLGETCSETRFSYNIEIKGC